MLATPNILWVEVALAARSRAVTAITDIAIPRP
jgi:hypothetical protein